MSNTPFFEVIHSTDKAKKIVQNIPGDYKSEMTFEERTFLAQMIINSQPRKMLELGVAAGGSSVIILSTAQELYYNNSYSLFSIDIDDNYYYDPTLKSGYIIKNYPSLKTHHTLYTGGLALEFMDKIGGQIDFALIDTAHVIPGEILDFLMVFPFLKEDATIVFHDTNLHARISNQHWSEWQFVNNLLISSIYEKKYFMGDFIYGEKKFDNTYLPNISAIKLCKETKFHMFNIFNLLSIGWQYSPTDNQIECLSSYFKRFYDDTLTDYFNHIVYYQKYYFPHFQNLYLNRIHSPELKQQKNTNTEYDIYNTLNSIHQELITFRKDQTPWHRRLRGLSRRIRKAL